MRLSKPERESVRQMFGGLCAYCGEPLGDRWHADHVEPVFREWWKKTDTVERPENDRIDNLMPSCPPCNIDKHAMSLESWRAKLANGPAVLARNTATYRHSLRFRLIQETPAPIVFHFERARSGQAAPGGPAEARGPDDQEQNRETTNG